MNRTRHDDESLALAEQSVGAAVRRGPARAIARWVFILGGFAGLVCVMLAVAAGINGSARSSTEVLATPGTPISHSFSLHGAPDAVAQVGGRTAEAWHVPRDGGNRRSDTGEATLESETKDDEDARSHSSAPGPLSRLAAISSSRRMALRSRPAAYIARRLVSTGLARGPPLAS